MPSHVTESEAKAGEEQDGTPRFAPPHKKGKTVEMDFPSRIPPPVLTGLSYMEGGVMDKLGHATDRAKKLFGATAVGTPLDHFKSKLMKELNPPADKGMDMFDLLAHVGGFQQDNVRNQRDSAVSVLVSRQMSSKGSHDVGPALLRYRTELLWNYRRWCKHVGAKPAEFHRICKEDDTTSRGGDDQKRHTARAALETALCLLLWGEAANLRFCPEFLCFLFHKSSIAVINSVLQNDTTLRVLGGGLDKEGEPRPAPPTYLDGIIRPAYELIEAELTRAASGHGDTMDHVDIKNYDDFNEIFWRKECLLLSIKTMFTFDRKGMSERKGPKHRHQVSKMFEKTFTERQSWALCIFNFWRIHTMLIVSLHWLIVFNVCYRKDYCNVKWVLSPVTTLYLCSLIKDAYDLIFAVHTASRGGGSYLHMALVGLRAGVKGGVLYFLVQGLLDARDDLISFVSLVALAWSIGSEVLIWLGLSLYLPPYLTFLLGVDVVNLYTRVHRLTPLWSRFRYTLFWAMVMGTKLAFSFFVVLSGLIDSTFRIYKNDVGSEYDFSAYRVPDKHNLTIIAALWLGGVTVYFVDTLVWFVVWSNVLAAFEGLRRRVGEVNDSASIIGVFLTLPKRFWPHTNEPRLRASLRNIVRGSGKGRGSSMRAPRGREEVREERPDRRVVDREFAHVWNEVATSWRGEDIICDEDLLKLRYFAISTRRWKPVEQEGKKTPIMKESVSYTKVLTPEFLFSGALQRFEKAAADFSKSSPLVVQAIAYFTRLERHAGHIDKILARAAAAQEAGQDPGKDVLKAEKNTADMRKRARKAKEDVAVEQYKFLRDEGATNRMTNLALEQLATTLAVMLDSLCRDVRLSDALWGVQRGLREGNESRSLTLRAIATAVKKNLLIKVWEMPKVVQALTDLTKALNKLDWGVCASLLDRLLESLTTVIDGHIDPEDCRSREGKVLGTALRHLFRTITDIRRSPPWGKEGVFDTFQAFQKDNAVFLERTQVFLQASISSQPGHLQNDEALRRMRFFVNSMFVEQPQGTGIVEAMPAFSTLTPYYKEDVLSRVEDLREITEDGVTVIEYLRTIYQHEWNAFVERMCREYSLPKEELNGREGGGEEEGEEEEGDTLGISTREVILRVLEKILFEEDASKKKQHSEYYAFGEGASTTGGGGGGGGGGGEVGDQHGELDHLDLFLASAVERQEQEHQEEEGLLLPHHSTPTDDRDGERSRSRSRSPATAIRYSLDKSGPVESDVRRLSNTLAETLARSKKKQQLRRLEERLEVDIEVAVQRWASFRAQTLARTVRGFMMFGRAIRLLAAVEVRHEFQPEEEDVDIRCPSDLDAAGGDEWTPSMVLSNATLKTDKCEEYDNSLGLALHAHRYVVAAQVYKAMKEGNAADKQKAKAIEDLAKEYPGLHIAYADEHENKHYSVLEKWDHTLGRMVEEYRVELPGKILLGEGKPNNQNHALIFTRGEAVQAVDMNQDKGLENALRCKQLLEEFQFGDNSHPKRKPPNIGRIVGYREHVFTHNVSSPAYFFSLQELNFVTATQRVVSNPLEVRFHYGHPDLFDKVTTMTMGGMSKSSKGVNLSEDIFAGFNWVLRGGVSTQADYIECGKGRDTGVSQITGFTAKISMGNGMQARSREIHRLASQFDFPRLMSFYYSTVGGFMNQVFLILSITTFMYSRVYLSFDPNTAELVDELGNLDGVSAQYALQVGFLLIIPIPLVVAVERGFVKAASTFTSILLRLAPLFFIFSTGTNAHYTHTAITNGQAIYKATGRGFAISHEPFLQSFQAYFLSHFQPAFELLVLLVIYAAYTPLPAYSLETYSVYLVVIGWMFVPIIFNPKGLDITYVQAGASQYWNWMVSEAADARSSWNAWFDEILRDEYRMMTHKKVAATVRRLRFGLLSWGFLKAFNDDVNSKWFNLAWVSVISVGVVVVMLLFSLRRTDRKRRESNIAFAYESRMCKRMGILLLIPAVVLAGVLLVLTTASLGQLLSLLAGFLSTFFLITNILTLWVKDAAVTIGAVRTVFFTLHVAIGAVIQLPVLLLSLLPFLAGVQTRLLFNAEFADRYEIARIVQGERERLKVELKKE